MRLAGCIVTLENGQKRVLKGLVLPEDLPPKRKPAKTRAAAAAAPEKPGAQAPATTPDGAGKPPAPAAPPEPTFDQRFEKPWTSRSTGQHASPEAEHAKKTGFSTAIIENLAVIRTGIVRNALAKRFDLAFDLAAYLLIMDTEIRIYGNRPADVRLALTSLRPTGRSQDDDFATSNPGEALYEKPSGEWMSLDDEVNRWDAFRALPDPEKQRLFAQAVAGSLYNQVANQHRPVPAGERLIELLDIDFAAAVRPTEKYFWRRLTRAHMLDIAETVVGKEWAKARRNHKKGALAADMATVFGADPQGRAALDPETRDRIEQWAMPGFVPGDTSANDTAPAKANDR